MAENVQKCLFCGKPKSATNKRFIGGGGAIICEDCIKASNDILVRLRKADEEKKQADGLVNILYSLSSSSDCSF